MELGPVANPNFTKLSSSPWVARLLGVLNLVFAGVGLIALLINAVGLFGLPPSFTGGLARFFFRMGFASLVLLPSLAYAGTQLLRRNPRASVLCSAVFVVETAFLLVYWLTWKIPISPVSVTAITGGFMNLGLALQIVTAYPVVGLILLRLPLGDHTPD